MNAQAIIETIALVIKEAAILGPIIIKSVEDATPFAKAIYDMIAGHTVTQAELDELVEKIQVLSAQLQKPIPDEGQ